MNINTLWPWIIISAGLIGLFGFDYLSQFIKTFVNYLSPGIEGYKPPAKTTKDNRHLKLRAKTKDSKSKATTHQYEWMKFVLSLLVTLVALYVIINNHEYGEDGQKWSYGVIGLVLGHWFKR